MFSSVLLFFEFTAPEVMLIFFVILLLFGGDKLPQLARGLGKGIRDFKDASEGVKREITNQIDNFESKKETEAAAASTAASVNEAPVAPNEAPAVIETPDNTMPVAEIGSTATIEPVHEPVAESKPAHLSETPIENILPADASAHHEEHKS